MGEESHQLRVLAVDDDPRIRLLLAEVLSHASCRVITACDGAEAVQILQQEPVDLLITDYDMPQMNGLELIRWSKARFPRVPAVMITGRNSQPLAAEGQACGATRVLLKPFPVEQLLSLVEEIRDTAPSP